MLTEICAEIKNYFCKKIYTKEFSIINGELKDVDFLQDGQYFRIVGSVMNDGVYQYPAYDLNDEKFSGAIWSMAVPPAVIDLAGKIEKFCKSDDNKPTAYVSESFGGYSYSKATDSSGIAAGWKTVFAKELNAWRKINV